MVGFGDFDDAAVYRVDGGTALVLTVDVISAIVDDPFVFGQIAAANSLSDVYAMGGRPVVALNVVGFPDRELPIDVLGEILRGGAERVAAAGAAIGGGHSVRDAEVRYGLAVTGLVHPDRVVTNAGAAVGDVLILTKPLGSGVLATAARSGLIGADAMAEAIAAMVRLNSDAADAMRETGVRAATDVTGFGLIGHAREIAVASGVTIELDAAQVPLLTDTLRLAAEGALTRANRSNVDYLREQIHADGVDETLLKVLVDAQTSGGMLICVSAAKEVLLVQNLRRCGAMCAARVGRVVPREAVPIVVRPG